MKFIKRALPIFLALLFTAGAIGFITLGGLQEEARHIAFSTTPRLSASADINSLQAENFIRVLLAITADTPSERAAYRREVEKIAGEVNESIAAYRRSLQAGDDHKRIDDLEQTRQAYHALREQALELSARGHQAEALALAKKVIWPAYRAYTEAGDRLFDHDVQTAVIQGRHIMKVCTVTRIAVAAIGVVIFVGGFVTSFIMMYALGSFGSAKLEKST